MPRFLAALVALKMFLFAVLVAGTASIAHAEAPSTGGEDTATETAATDACTGENLIEAIGRENPEAMARIEREAAAIPFGEARFWRLEKEGRPASYLYGTMHVADPRATALDPAVADALDGARVVALELAETDPAAQQAALNEHLGRLMYLDGTTLAERLPPETVTQLKALLAERPELPWQAMERMRPFMAMTTLMIPACEMRRMATAPVLDDMIGRRARAKGTPVIGLETVEEQLDAVFGLPEDLNLRALQTAVAMGPVLPDLFETMVALYERGEIGLLWALSRDVVLLEGRTLPAGFSEEKSLEDYAVFQERVVDERNRTMLRAMRPLIDEGNAFVAVGALHLPGKQGLVNLLAKEGWTVTPLP